MSSKRKVIDSAASAKKAKQEMLSSPFTPVSQQGDPKPVTIATRRRGRGRGRGRGKSEKTSLAEVVQENQLYYHSRPICQIEQVQTICHSTHS